MNAYMDNDISSRRHCLPSEHQLWQQSELGGICKELSAWNTSFFPPEPAVALRQIMNILLMYWWQNYTNLIPKQSETCSPYRNSNYLELYQSKVVPVESEENRWLYNANSVAWGQVCRDT